MLSFLTLLFLYESLTIPVEPEKQNLTPINVNPISQNKESLNNIYGDYLVTSLNLDQKIILDFRMHPVFQGFVWAYKNHRPITISPDIIWLLITQAFSNHVSFNAEKLRSMFVNFTGKEEIVVDRTDLNFYKMKPKDWETSIFPEFVSKIEKYTGKDITDVLTPDFTTTTPISRAVGQLTIMSTMKNYFDYRLILGGCGFPFVTIEGSVEDWNKIKEKLIFLAKYEFEWFTNRITPIINEIIKTKKGNINTLFWKKMIRVKDSEGSYHPGYVDGWFASFFPYSKEGYLLNGSISDNIDLQDEMQTIPFILEIINQKKHDCQFLAGFVGLIQDEKTKSIKPEIGWFINEKSNNQLPNSWGRSRKKYRDNLLKKNWNRRYFGEF